MACLCVDELIIYSIYFLCRFLCNAKQSLHAPSIPPNRHSFPPYRSPITVPPTKTKGCALVANTTYINAINRPRKPFATRDVIDLEAFRSRGLEAFGRPLGGLLARTASLSRRRSRSSRWRCSPTSCRRRSCRGSWWSRGGSGGCC